MVTNILMLSLNYFACKFVFKAAGQFLFLIVFVFFTFTHNFTRAATFSPDYSWKEVNLIGSNGEPITKRINRTKTTVAWASDNITKTTRYEYADKSTHSVSERVDAVVTKTVVGMVQTTTTRYANPKAKPVVTKETGALVADSVRLSRDSAAKSATYRFRDGTQSVVTTNRTKTTVAWASDNITKTTRYEYADKSTHSVSERVDAVVTKTVVGMVQTTTTSYGNPVAKPVVTKETGALVADSVGLTPDFASKTATYRFSDGTESVVTTNRTKTTVAWASDNITKTTRYEYADKSIHIVTTTIQPTITVSWSTDNITKTTVTEFANGIRNSSVVIVQPTESPVQYTDAIYPSTWASGSGGVVTAPKVSDKLKVYGNGHIDILEAGTVTLPFLQSTLSGRNIADPNSFVQSSTSTYDLRWGTPDPAGPVGASAFRSAGERLKLQSPLQIAGYDVGGVGYYQGYYGSVEYLSGGLTLKRPSDDVLDAWDKGWTGKGTKILVIDYFGHNIGRKRAGASYDGHGIYVSVLAGFTATGSEILTLHNDFTGYIGNAFGGPLTPGTLSAINMSFDYTNDSSASRDYANSVVNFLVSSQTITTGILMNDAVLVKAAGNDYKSLTNKGLMTNLSVALIENPVSAAKTLIVGALHKDGSIQDPAVKANYSNTPGSDVKFQNRFVMANGTSPFADKFAYKDWDYGNTPVNDGTGVGTSFAAPRVAGYIGILRQKFPNLNAEKSSSIILDTARTDTLWCHPNCQPSVVGRGEASLSRALAPVGRLR